VFFPRIVTLELVDSHLRGLRISLNTPVVSTEELAVGPARAGLLVHQEPDGRPNVTIGIRSLRSGEVVLYSFEGDLREHSSLDVGIDAGLSFAESMGFLFDEDELGAGDADSIARSMGLWNDLMGSSGAGTVSAGAAAPDAPSEPLRNLAELSADDLEIPALPALDPAEPVPAAPEGYVPQFDGDLGGIDRLDLEGGLDPDDVGVDLGVSARSFEVAEGAPELAQPGIAHDSDAPPLASTVALDLGVEAVELGVADPADLEGPGESGEDLFGDAPELGAADPVVAAEPSDPGIAVREAVAAAEPAPEAAPPVGLSKFRSAPKAPTPPEERQTDAAESETSARTELARVRIVRRGSGGSHRPHPIIRLLGAF
jgi:hypothetical protein